MENAVLTTAEIFSEAGKTLTGYMTLTGDFFNGLWNQPMGKIVISASLAGAAIGLAYRLFIRKKHI